MQHLKPTRLLRAAPVALGCLALLGATRATAQGTPTGADIPGRFGATSLLATQTRPTVFGDNGNELNQLFARSDGTYLHIGISGNLSSGNGIVILLDTDPSSNTVLDFNSAPGPRVTAFKGTTFDAGFYPKYAIDTNVSGSTLYVDRINTDGSKVFLGSAASGGGAGSLNGGDSSGNTQYGSVALDNSNQTGVKGVDYNSPGSNTPSAGLIEDAPAASTGLELSLALSQFPGIKTNIRILAVLVGNNGDVSNQMLPGLPDTFGDMGYPGGGYVLNFPAYAGTQYTSLGLTADSGDLPAATAAWALSPVYVNGSSTPDPHPPITSTPTVFGNLTYAVGYNGQNGILFALDNTNKTGVTANLAWPAPKVLDGAVTGRVAIKQIGITPRIYMQTDKGTIYMMDAATGDNLRSFNPLGKWVEQNPGNEGKLPASSTTAATPAVIDNGSGTPIVYTSVKDATGTVYLVQVSDTTNPANLQVPKALPDVLDVSAPSVIADGAKIQFGATMAGVGGSGPTGAAYTVNTSDLTPTTGASTAGPVLAPPVLTLDTTQPVFFVGDESGTFSAFYVSNANPVWSKAVGTPTASPVSQTAFMDYSVSPNIIYFATDGGSVYAKRIVDGSDLEGYPQKPVSGVTGGVALLKANRNSPTGDLYVPTSTGLFVLNTGTPATATRYPLTGLVSTPAAGAASGGSVIAVTSGNGAPVPGGINGTNPAGFAGGNVYGLKVR